MGTLYDGPLEAHQGPDPIRHCLSCGQALPSWSRSDRRTCSMGCRTRLCRARKAARHTSATGSSGPVPGSDTKWTQDPQGPEPALDGASQL